MPKILLICFLLISNAYSEEGCPESSFCNKAMGNTHAKWIKAVKTGKNRSIEKFRQINGIPLGVWSTSVQEKAISWNSPCQLHNTEDRTVYLVDLFLKKFSAPKEFILEKTWKQDAKGRITSFPISRGEIPGYFDGTNLVLIKEAEGIYYGVKISSKGRLKVFQYPKKRIPSPQSIKCPQTLTDAFNKHFASAKIYQDHFCKQIWNTKIKKYENMVFGWSCL